MVFFVCDECGETLRKKQVCKHNLLCPTAARYSCMDCQRVFDQHSYTEHTKCITEEQKYGGANHVLPEVNKDEQKQDAWVRQVRAAIRLVDEPQLKKLLRTIRSQTNIPRKESKFVRFLQNSLCEKNRERCVDAWNAIKRAADAMAEKRKMAAEAESEPTEETAANGTATTTEKRTIMLDEMMMDVDAHPNGGECVDEPSCSTAAGTSSSSSPPSTLFCPYFLAVQNAFDRFCRECHHRSSSKRCRVLSICDRINAMASSSTTTTTNTDIDQQMLDLLRKNSRTLARLGNKLCPNCEDRLELIRLHAEQIAGDDDEQHGNGTSTQNKDKTTYEDDGQIEEQWVQEDEDQGKEDAYQADQEDSDHGKEDADQEDGDQGKEDADQEDSDHGKEDADQEDGDQGKEDAHQVDQADDDQGKEDAHQADQEDSDQRKEAAHQADQKDGDHGKEDADQKDGDHGKEDADQEDGDQGKEDAHQADDDQGKEDAYQADQKDGDQGKEDAYQADQKDGDQGKEDACQADQEDGDLGREDAHQADQKDGDMGREDGDRNSPTDDEEETKTPLRRSLRGVSKCKKEEDGDKFFVDVHELREHDKMHHADDDDKPCMPAKCVDRQFQCKRCGMPFVNARVLNTHVRLYASRLSSASNAADDASAVNDKDRPFRCKLCCCHFARAAGLKRHMHCHDGMPNSPCHQSLPTADETTSTALSSSTDFVDFVLGRKATDFVDFVLGSAQKKQKRPS